MDGRMLKFTFNVSHFTDEELSIIEDSNKNKKSISKKEHPELWEKLLIECQIQVDDGVVEI